MRLLLDTHVLFWWLTNDPRLEQGYMARILDENSHASVSAATGWEIAVKVRIGKWPEAAALLPDLTATITAARLTLLPLTLAQMEAAGSFAVDHKDPFDRMIAAQALDLDMAVVTVDPAFAAFGCKLL